MNKLNQNGFDSNFKDETISKIVGVSMCLNRMKSLSSRKNESLRLELASKKDHRLQR